MHWSEKRAILHNVYNICVLVWAKVVTGYTSSWKWLFTYPKSNLAKSYLMSQIRVFWHGLSDEANQCCGIRVVLNITLVIFVSCSQIYCTLTVGGKWRRFPLLYFKTTVLITLHSSRRPGWEKIQLGIVYIFCISQFYSALLRTSDINFPHFIVHRKGQHWELQWGFRPAGGAVSRLPPWTGTTWFHLGPALQWRARVLFMKNTDILMKDKCYSSGFCASWCPSNIEETWNKTSGYFWWGNVSQPH